MPLQLFLLENNPNVEVTLKDHRKDHQNQEDLGSNQKTTALVRRMETPQLLRKMSRIQSGMSMGVFSGKNH